MKELGQAATNSMKSVPQALAYLAVVVVQDALEDAESNPENLVHARLLDEPIFRCAPSHAILLVLMSYASDPCCLF